MTNPAPSPADFPHLHDIKEFNRRLVAAFARLQTIRPYKMEKLGEVGGHGIFLLSPENIDPASPNILSAGGFHGEEPAGPWGILEYLESATPEELKKINHSFLPLVNPTGFEKGQRLNMYGENPNRGFVPENRHLEEGSTGNNIGPSVEGKILMQHLPRLVVLSKDGCVSQHEDDGLSSAFVFINERDKCGEDHSAFTKALRKQLKDHFSLLPDGGAETLIEPKIKDGVWWGDRAGAFDDLLFEKGIPRAATTETPGLKLAKDRVACNKALTRAFARYAASRKSSGGACGSCKCSKPKGPAA